MVNNKQKEIRFRVNDIEKEIIERKAKEFHFLTVSEYVRFISMSCTNVDVSVDIKNVQ